MDRISQNSNMNIQEKLKQIKNEKRMGLMTHVVVGYPTRDATPKIVAAMEGAEVDFVELQIPFSDPLADGPSIMHACDVALAGGITLEKCFSIAKVVIATSQIPILFMAYYNTVFTIGVEEFVKRASGIGIAGLIVPDIPPEEEGHEHFIAICKKYKMSLIRILSPSSTPERIKKNIEVADEFIYLVSRAGTTGAQQELDPHVKEYVERVRSFTNLPIAVGFGISDKSHVDTLRGQADIAIVGSAVIDVIERNKNGDYISSVSEFIRSLK